MRYTFFDTGKVSLTDDGLGKYDIGVLYGSYRLYDVILNEPTERLTGKLLLRYVLIETKANTPLCKDSGGNTLWMRNGNQKIFF